MKMGEVKATLGIFIGVSGEGRYVGGRLDLGITACSFRLDSMWFWAAQCGMVACRQAG